MNARSASGTILSGLAAALLMVLFAQAGHAQESLQWLYNGRPRDDWVAALDAAEASQRSDAVKAVATFRDDQPKRIETLLLEMLEEDPSHVVRRAAAWALVSSETRTDVSDAVVAALQSRLLDSDEHSSVRKAAGTALGSSMVPGARALADSIAQIEDEAVRREAIEELSRMPKDLVNDLVSLPDLRAIMQEAKEESLPPSFTDRIVWLRRLLQQHDDPSLRAKALAHVQAAREIADITVGKFVGMVNERKTDTDAITLRALWSWSAHPKAREAVAVLSDIVQTGEDHQRFWAAAALAIAPELEGGDPDVGPFVELIVQNIKQGKMGSEGISLILQVTAANSSRRNELFRDILSELEGDHADPIQRVWADVLGNVGGEEPVIMSSLLNDDDPRVRREAVNQVKRNGWDDPQIVSALAEILRNPDEQRYVLQAALEALAEIDPEGKKVSALDDATLIRLIQLPWISERHPWLRKRLREGGEPLVEKLVHALNEPAEVVRQEQAASDYSPSSEIIEALATVGEPAIPALRRLIIEHAIKRKEFEAVDYLDLDKAQRAASALAKVEPQGMETLIELSRHDKPAVRREAVNALAFVGQVSEKNPPQERDAALVVAMRDDVPAVRGQALQSIGRLQSIGHLHDPDARAFAVVVENLQHEDVEIAVQAVRTLRHFSEERPQQVVQAYAGALRRDQRKLRQEILHSLKDLGATAEAALPEVQSLVSREELRTVPLQTIAAMGPAAEQAKNLLLEQLASPDQSRRFWAAVALSQFESGRGVALPALIEYLSDESQMQDSRRGFRAVAAEALGDLGPQARPAIEPLLELVHRELQKPPPSSQDSGGSETHPDEVIKAAVEALEGTGWRPDETTAVLDGIKASAEELAEKDNPHAQAAAKEAMKLFRLGKPPPVDQLVQQLVRDEERLRAMGEKAVPILVDALDEESDVVGFAMQGLGMLGEKAAPAVPQLLDVVRDRRWRPSVRASAIESLGEIGEAARPAIPYLRQLAQLDGISRDELRLARAAREALARIETP